jgi:hypothetical protein
MFAAGLSIERYAPFAPKGIQHFLAIVHNAANVIEIEKS